MAKLFIFFWGIAGLLTLDVVLRAPSHFTRRAAEPIAAAAPATPAPPAVPLPVIQALRTRCELPAGTVVFVIRKREP